jgi:pantoate--beta-alanine ligase
MEIIRNVDEMVKKFKKIKAEGKTIGFVPTMGFLHEGHISLIKNARNENEVVVVSVFVNPTQFGPNEDLDNYPRNEEMDTKLCVEAGCDYIFMPNPADMYREGYNTYVDVYGITEGLCGASRPGHFRGVCTVVLKLFHIIKPTRAYFGQKDAQQLAVIKKMVRELNVDVEVIGCPIIREPDGLALSSRNTYLSKDEREQALVLSKSLKLAKELIDSGVTEINAIKAEMMKLISTAKDSNVDYIEFVDNFALKSLTKIDGSTQVLIALAIKIGKTRLIDNMVV